MALNPMLVPLAEERKHRHPHREGDRGRRDSAINLATPRAAAATGGWEGPLPGEAAGGVRPCQHLDLRLLASRTVRDQISVILSHSVM